MIPFEQRREILERVSQTFGTPSYVYFLDDIRERTAELRTAFAHRFRLSYAVKANPNLKLLERLRAPDLNIDAFDISSGGELRRALAAGCSPSQLSFTGPGKRDAELSAAVDAGIGEVVVESVAEACRLASIAKAAGRIQRVLIRLAPKRVPKGFGLNLAGKPTQFGIDEEECLAAILEVKQLDDLELAGFHIYSGTQCLDEGAIVENWALYAALFQEVCVAHDLRPRKLVFGAGLGIPYYDHDAPLKLLDVASGIQPILETLTAQSRFGETELHLELGRYLVGEAGDYLTSVVHKKPSRGTLMVVCDGGMNHHLAAAGHFGQVIPRNFRLFRVTKPSPLAVETAHQICGPLCTTIDTLGRNLRMPELEVGDVIGIPSSGAYGLTASPTAFIGHDPPREVLVTRNALGDFDLEEISA